MTGNRDDLTSGPITKKLLTFFLPIAAGSLFQQLYNAVDAFVVGKFVGTEALAAVGGTPATITGLIIGFCVALTGGAAVVISQFFGAGKNEILASAVKTSYIMSAVIGAVVGILTVVYAPWMLKVLKTGDEVFADSLLYQRIYFSAGVFTLIYNMGASIIRAVGNSRFPVMCLFLGCGINIVLDVVFVVVLGLGVAGVAWATFIAMAVSAVAVTLKLIFVKAPYRLTMKAKFSSDVLYKMMKIGLPSGLQSSMYGAANMILQVGINTLGTVAVASWAMSGRVDGVFWAVSDAFGMALTTFIGQNYGAGNIDRVKSAAKKGMVIFCLMTVFISSVLMVLGRPALKVLTDDMNVVETTWIIMIYFVPAYIIWSMILVYNSVLRGMGDVLIPSVILGLGICLFRVVWMTTVFRFFGTLEVLCLCYPASWFVTDIVIFIYYRKKEKRMVALND